MWEILSVFTNISTVVASLGLVLATSSFISGLQLVRGASIVERKIHRFNGFSSIVLFIILAAMYFVNSGVRFWPILAWLTALWIIIIKLYIVRKRRKAFKYVSWIGGSLILIWLFLVYIHIPV